MKRRAILSVYDKAGIVEFAKGLLDLSFEIFSTGGTARVLKDAGLEVRDVTELTGFPESLGGRLKTLHPGVLAGLLAKRTKDHEEALQNLGLRRIHLVAVNLYPFEKTVQREGVTEEEAIENIDIGGPTMLRAAAKNYEAVTVIVDPEDYGPVLGEFRAHGETTLETRRRLALKAFVTTALYDAAIARYFGIRLSPQDMPDCFVLAGLKIQDLRYGENPHQRAALYSPPGQIKGIVGASKRQGKVLSFNNYVDMEAAWALVREFNVPAVAIIKHTNPCGVGTDPQDIKLAYEKALQTDPVSAFGGIVACNREVDEALAARICEHFFEVVIAPRIKEEAAKVFLSKKNLRVMEMGDAFFEPLELFSFRHLSGGFLVQDVDPTAEEARQGQVVTKRAPSEEEWLALDFVWRVTKHVKSNAIVFARADRTVGIGAGQMSRVDAARVAVMKARSDLKGTVVGSDAFFPFPDGLEVVAEAGATAVIQPGGSIRDKEVIEAADKLGLAMVFTGRRHFKH